MDEEEILPESSSSGDRNSSFNVNFHKFPPHVSSRNDVASSAVMAKRETYLKFVKRLSTEEERREQTDNFVMQENDGDQHFKVDAKSKEHGDYLPECNDSDIMLSEVDDDESSNEIHPDVNDSLSGGSSGADTSEHDFDSDETGDDSDEEGKSEQPYQCKVCGIILASKSLLKGHLAFHSIEQAYRIYEGNLNSADNEGLMSRLGHEGEQNLNEQGKAFRCEICGKQFLQKRSFKVHIKSHTGELPYKCEICGKGFSTSTNFEAHVKSHDVKIFKCKFCDQSFKTQKTYQLHCSTHTEEPSFKCDVCEKKFSNERKLTVHKATHSDSRPFKCDVCEKTFSMRQYLWLHKKIHLKEKQYKCNICGKAFAHSGSRSAHMRLHTGELPFECRICARLFRSRSNMNKHLLTHSEEKSFKCEHCNKTFQQQKSLTIHKRLHFDSGEKQHECEMCGKKFREKSYMRRHIKLMHPNETISNQEQSMKFSQLFKLNSLV